jgi:hypothetical protein
MLTEESKLIVIYVRGYAVDENFHYCSPAKGYAKGKKVKKIKGPLCDTETEVVRGPQRAHRILEEALKPFRKDIDYVLTAVGYCDVTVVPTWCELIPEMLTKLRRVVNCIEDDGDWPDGNVCLYGDDACNMWGLHSARDPEDEEEVKRVAEENEKWIKDFKCFEQLDVEDYLGLVEGKNNYRR